MGLEKNEFHELLSKFIDDVGDEDPELSIIPDGKKFPIIGNATRKLREKHLYNNHLNLSVSQWKVASETNPIDRRGQDMSSTLQVREEVDFSLGEKIGQGGFGDVWEAIQTSMGRRIAIKRLRLQTKDKKSNQDTEKTEADLKADFRKEALTTAILEHPNIIPVHDLGEDEKGRPLIAMKLVKGESWDELLRQDFSLPKSEFLAIHLPILIDVAQAVAFAHSRGIIHRDLKPSQVMVGEFGEVLLMDWGIAMVYDKPKITEHFSDLNPDLIPDRDTAFSPAGTPAYMAPEQTKETAHDIGPWTDIYLLGGILYFMLCHRAPHACGNAKEAFNHAINGHVKPPKFRQPTFEIPADLNQVAMKALETIPHDRYATVQDFLAGIQGYLTGAGNKSESVELTRQAAELMKEELSDYNMLNEVQNILLRAINLWADNHEAKLKRQEVTELFATKAINNKDLVLAKLMLAAIDNQETVASFEDQIQAQEKILQRSQKSHLILNIVITVLVLVFLFDLYLIFKWYFKTQ